MAYTQENRLIAIDTPLGQDVLLLQSLTGREGISRLFSFQLDLASEKESISFKDVVGHNVTIRVSLIDHSPRYFNGFVNRFAQSGSDARFTHYQMEVVPWLWFLTRIADCRIFQEKSIPDIIEEVFKSRGFKDYKLSLTSSYDQREYCVQYRETDFNFVSRLMEQYGIFYFFEHENGKHTLVLADSESVHQPCPKQATVHYSVTPDDLSQDVVRSWQMEQELRPGKYSHTDYNFETPSANLFADEPTVVSVGGNSKFEIYDYPGEYLNRSQGKTLAGVRMQEEEATHLVANGSSDCRAFTSGYKITLEDHYRMDVNDSYVLTEVHHVASVGSSYSLGDAGTGEHYSNQFSCIPAKVPFRPARVTPRPFVQGLQTALVVGKSSEEIWVDKYGRIKVQFYWDRLGKKDEKSSCWIRVSQPWAGKNWGAVNIPRIGQEVIVDFLEGDPDRPIITGRVYNAEQMPPYPLPEDGVISGVKSNSSKGGGGYNEISMNDTKGKEMITVHAQYDMGTTVEHNDTQTVHVDRTITVDGTHTETITGDTTIAISKGKLNHTVAANTADYTVEGALTETYNTTQTTTVAKEIDICSVGAHIHVTADADEIVLKSGLSQLVMKRDGTIVLSGKSVTVRGTEEVTTVVNSQSVTCNNQMVHSQGARVNSTAVGMHEISGALIKVN